MGQAHAVGARDALDVCRRLINHRARLPGGRQQRVIELFARHIVGIGGGRAREVAKKKEKLISDCSD